jgi:Transposase
VICPKETPPVSEHLSDSRSFEVLPANPVRLSSSPARSYRSWSEEEKARIVGETLVAGANVSAIARSIGPDPSQLFAWRRMAMAWGWSERRAGRSSPRVLKQCGGNMVEMSGPIKCL